MFATIVLAVLPTAGLIALGTGLRRTGFLGDAFWPQAERLAYFILLPALFLHGLATADLSAVPVARFAAVIIAAILCVAAGLVALRRRVADDGPAFTSVFQGGIRFNNYIGVTVAAGLLGPLGIPLAALANAVIVPTVNVLCIVVFARFGRVRASPLGILRGVATNPLVVSCAMGGLMRVVGLTLPPVIEPMLKALGQASLPVGLLCVGSAVNVLAIRSHARGAVLASAAKFVAMPLVTVLGCMALGVGGPSALVAVVFQSLPTASSSYILARQLGGDAEMMAGITAVQTLAAAVTMPLTLALAAAWLGA